MSIMNWIFNKVFGCKCKSFGYGTCIKCGKQYRRVKDKESI